MNRNKYRGKAIDTALAHGDVKINIGDFVYGSLLSTRECETFIVGPIRRVSPLLLEPEFYVKVDPKTVGQYTGIYDVNGIPLYEGDLVKGYTDSPGKVVTVKRRITKYTIGEHEYSMFAGFKRIGNIHDNPRLMET